MADISKIKTLDGTTYDLKDAIARYHLPYGVCETGANTTDKTVTIEGITELTAGLTVAVKFTNNNAMVGPTLNVNGLGAKTIKQYGTVSVAAADETSGWRANSLVILVYDGTYWYFNKGYNTNSTYTVTSVDCLMAGNSDAKRSVNSTYYVLKTGNIFECTVQSANTYASALTLNINNTGAKPIYINGHPSSTTNYSIPAGKYLVYYDGNAYHFRTDNRQPINISGTVNGYSINKSVPSNAVFTDTTYDAATATPLMDGTGAVGTSVKYAREDHRHPTDTSRAAATHTHSTQDLIRPSGLRGLADVTLQTLVNTTRANRLAFLPADQIIIEKTVDGGTTWTDAGIADSTKVGLFSETRVGVNLPRINDLPNILCGLRITITGMKYNVPSGTSETNKYNYWNSDYVVTTERYCQLKELYFWLSSNNNSIGVKVERATGANPNNWSAIFNDTSFYMTGWSGCDYLSFSQGVFGGGTTQTGNYWNYRITLMTLGANGSKTEYGSSTGALSIMEIRGYGDTWWAKANEYMANDKMYTHDSSQNVTFPASVTATSFSGNATSATKATQDESGNNIKATYASSMSISDHTITLKNKNGTSLGTVTVPDNNTTYTANTSKLVTTTVPNVTSAGSAPTLGTAISADDITAWDAGSTPTLGTAIPADDITAWNAGSTPTLGTAIPADDITSWTTNTPTAFSVSGEKLTITSGTAASLSYTAKSIPNVTSVGSVPSLSYTPKSIPNVTSVGSVPSLSYTARSIPNVTSVGSAPTLGTAITVATGSLASNGGGGTVATGITAS